MDYDASKVHGSSKYFDASKLSAKPQLGKYNAKLLDQKTLSHTEKNELVQILRSATKTGSSSALSDKQLIHHYLAELHGPNASTQAKMTSAAGHVFAQSEAQSSKLQSKAVQASLIQDMPGSTSSFRLRMEGIHDAEFDMDIEAVEEVTTADRVPSRALGEDRLEFVIKGSDGSLQRVTISADQMADKLLIKKEKLLKAAREGALHSLFASKKEHLEALPKIVDSYQKVFEAYSQIKRSNALKPEQLMKIVKSYYKADVGSVFNKKRAWKEGEAVLLKFNKEKTGMKGMAFMARLEGGKMRIARFDLDETKFLGAGTFGSAYKVEQLDAGRQMVLKLAKRTFYLYHWAKGDIKNEYEILKDIHRDGTIPGIQEAPHAFFHISGAVDRVGFVGQKYDGDVADLVSDSYHRDIALNVLYKSCSDILGASAALHQRDIVHGDNKPANTFFILDRNKKTGTIEKVKVYLADFGGARKLEDIKKFDSGVTTSEYDPPGDREWRRAARKAGNREEFGKALKARDVYQRGVVLYQLLAGNFEPWEIDSNRTTKHPPAYPDAKFNEKPLREKGVPNEMIAQLKAMMDPDPKKRPDADMAKKNWDQLL